MKKNTLFICQAAIIAALYVVLTLVSPNPIGVFQVRFSECLTILPLFLPAAVPGLFIGCIVSNILANAVIWDIIFGSLATLIAAVLTCKLGRRHFFLAASFPVIANTVVVPPVLAYVYNSPEAIWIIYISIFAGEVISCGILGYILYRVLKRHFFHINK